MIKNQNEIKLLSISPANRYDILGSQYCYHSFVLQHSFLYCYTFYDRIHFCPTFSQFVKKYKNGLTTNIKSNLYIEICPKITLKGIYKFTVTIRIKYRNK